MPAETTSLHKLLWTAPLLMLCACEPTPNTIATVDIGSAGSQRFSVKFVGNFYDPRAYDNGRTIYLLTDSETGREYVGISGVGIAETGAHQAGKMHHQDER